MKSAAKSSTTPRRYATSAKRNAQGGKRQRVYASRFAQDAYRKTLGCGPAALAFRLAQSVRRTPCLLFRLAHGAGRLAPLCSATDNRLPTTGFHHRGHGGHREEVPGLLITYPLSLITYHFFQPQGSPITAAWRRSCLLLTTYHLSLLLAAD